MKKNNKDKSSTYRDMSFEKITAPTPTKKVGCTRIVGEDLRGGKRK